MRLIIYLSIAFFGFNTQSSTNKALDLQLISQQPYWLDLLKYEPDGNGFKSEITSTEFFLAKQGSTDPKAELEANINALFDDSVTTDEHVRCQFPERYRWLSEQLLKPFATAELAKCTSFQNWAKSEKLSSASLIYADGYLGNPASFFGHILLKLDYEGNDHGSNYLLDNSFNFGAAIPSEDGAIKYVLKGFFGGYFAAFKDDSFHRHHKAYAEQESRSLWRYQLNLSEGELNSLVSHLWELRERKFDYYYLNDNCASRMADLLAMIKPEWRFNMNTPWIQPISIFKTLVQDNEQAFRKIERISSFHQKFLTSYQQLSHSEKEALLEAENNYAFDKASYLDLPEENKINVLTTLMRYFDYQKASGNRDISTKRASVLKERFSLKAQQTKDNNDSNSRPPHLGQYPTTLRVSVANSDLRGTGASLTLRPTYYDLLSIDEGRLKDSNLEMGTLQIGFEEDKLFLKRFDLANILTLSPAKTDMREDNPLAWKIRIGLQSTNHGCLECLTFVNEVGIGKSKKTKAGLWYGLAEAKLQTRSTAQKRLSSAARLGVLFEINEAWKAQFELLTPIAGWQDKSSFELKWHNRFGKSNRSDWRINLDANDKEMRVELGHSIYWQ